MKLLLLCCFCTFSLYGIFQQNDVDFYFFWKVHQHIFSTKQTVTNYYLVGKLNTSLNLSSYLVSSWSKSLSISGGDSSCSWVLVHALGLIVKEEFKSIMLGRGWGCGELLVSSGTFTVIQRIRKSVPPQKHPHWKSFSTVFIVTPETGDDKYMRNQQLMRGAHTQGVVGVHQV